MRLAAGLAFVALALAAVPASAVGVPLDREVAAGDGPYVVVTETTDVDSSASGAIDWVLCPGTCGLDIGPGAAYTCLAASRWDETNGVPGLQRSAVGTTPADTRTASSSFCTPEA